MPLISNTPGTDGVIVFWRTSDSHKQQVNAALGQYALAEEAQSATLKRALTNKFGGPTVLVRPMADDGFAVINENRGDKGNTYTELFTARVDEGVITMQSYAPIDQAHKDAVEQAFVTARMTCPANRVATGMVHLIEGLGGIPLRPQGAVYYLPPSQVPEFTRVAKLIELASVNGDTAVYLMRTPTDENTARAVIDAVVYETTAEAEKIEHEVFEGYLGKRAMLTRETRASGLLTRLEKYEALFGANLAAVRDSLEKVKSAAATAALLNAANVGTDSNNSTAQITESFK